MQSTIIDVGMGLIFAYLLMALVCSGIQEWIAHLFDRRSRHLERGIRNLLGDQALASASAGKKMTLADMVLSHGAVRALGREGRMPSYIPAGAFAAAVTDSIRVLHANGAGQLSQSFLGNLGERAALRMATGAATSGRVEDMEEARQAIEKWFDEEMDRVSGWYKRESRVFIIVIALVLAAAFRVDTIALAERLYTDPALRAAVAESAKEFIARKENLDANATNEVLRERRRALDVYKLPVGWDLPDGSAFAAVKTIAGLIITALAASLGAPFWFDALSRLGSLRSAGKTPARAEPMTMRGPGSPALGALPVSVTTLEAPRAPPFHESSLSRHDMVDIQKRLGVDPATGELDDKTRKAISAYRERAGYEPGDELTKALVSELL